MAAQIIQFPVQHSNGYNNLIQLFEICDSLESCNFYLESVEMILIQTGKALQALYVGSILNEMAAGIMDAEEGAEEVERMFFHATAE